MRAEKEIKKNPNWKKINKAVTVCRWHDTMHRIPKDATRKLLKFINEFDKYAGYTINTQKFLSFLYTTSEGKLHGSE